MFNKDTTLGEIIATDEKFALVLIGFGLNCVECPMSQMETLEQACLVHDLDLGFVLNKLNEEAKK